MEQRYPGTAAEIERAVDGTTVMPSRTRHLGFGDLAAAWSVIDRLGVVGIVRATRRGIRLKQAARACRLTVLVPGVGGREARVGRRRARGGFDHYAVGPISRGGRGSPRLSPGG